MNEGTDLAEALASVARALLAEETLEGTLDRIAVLAVETIDGCDHAGVTLIEGKKVSTPGANSDVPVRADAIQYEVGEGPCLDAIKDHAILHVEDLRAEKRWPRFSARAAEEAGVRSVMCFRLFAQEDTMGALNLYSREVGAFGSETEEIGSLFAAHAAVALSGAREKQHLEQALRSRDVIGQAKGILMAREHVSEDEAFDMLRRASQRLNVKLRDVAERVAHAAVDPPGVNEGDGDGAGAPGAGRGGGS